MESSVSKNLCWPSFVKMCQEEISGCLTFNFENNIMLKTSRLASSIVNIIKTEAHPPRNLLEAPSNTQLQHGPSPNSAAVLASRTGTRFFFGQSRRGENAETKDRLRKYVSLDFAQEIYNKNKDRILPRHPGRQPLEAGILALIGYTSGGLDKHFTRFETQGHLIRDEKFKQDMLLLKKVLSDTIKLLKKTDVDVVRRNTQLHHSLLDAYMPGQQIEFDRITSVTLLPYQTYTGGNVDFIIRPKEGVVSVENLSVFTSSKDSEKSGEAEGILDPGSKYEVLEAKEDKENGGRSEDPDYPARTIVLNEVA